VFVYRAEMAPTSVAARAVQHIIRRFHAGSIEQFLTGMVDERVVSAEELHRLARKVRTARKTFKVCLRGQVFELQHFMSLV